MKKPAFILWGCNSFIYDAAFWVQRWNQAILGKPETLIKAVKNAQAAANYMDYRTGIISKDEDDKLCGNVKEIQSKAQKISG